MANGKEIERKFLYPTTKLNRFLRNEVDFGPVQFIFQFYTSYSPEIRYRGVVSINNELAYTGMNEKLSYTKTIKRGDGLEREEIETVISGSEFNLALVDAKSFVTKFRRVHRTIPSISIDFYQEEQDLHPLCILEIEYDSVEDSKEFPEVLEHVKFKVIEVTGDKDYSNSTLSKTRYSYINNHTHLSFVMKLLGMTSMSFWAESFGLKDSIIGIGRNTPPMKVIVENGASLRVFKAKKDGHASSSRLKFRGNYDIRLNVHFSEEQAYNYYNSLKEIAHKKVDGFIKDINSFNESF